MSDEQSSSNNNDKFIVPKLPFKKSGVDLNNKIDNSQDQPEQSSQQSSQQSSPQQEKKFPLPLSSLNPSKDVFFIEIIKDGTVLGREYLNRNRILLGRATDCDLIFEHCSISRYHAMLLWKENTSNIEDNGFFYLKDLESSHGTFLNKIQIESNKFLKLEPNRSFIKLGASSRLLLFSCINEDEEEEEIKTQESVKKEGHQFNFNEQSDNECMWGMGKDFDTGLTIYSSGRNSGLQIVLSILNENAVIDKTENDNAYISNAQKVIQNWFDYEGYEFEYQISSENNKFKCTITFPIEDQHVPISGNEEIKKKDAINSACLRACRILDEAEILFSWQKREKIEKRKKDIEDDEEDNLLDETGERESKKARLEALKNKKVDNLETLIKRFDELKKEIEVLKFDLEEVDKEMNVPRVSGNKDKKEDELDQYMNTMPTNKYNLNDLKIRKSKARMKILLLIKEKERIERLIKIAQPNLGSYSKVKNSNDLFTAPSRKVNDLIQKAKAKLDQKKQEDLTSNSNKSENKLNCELNIFNNLDKSGSQKTSLTFKSTKVTTKLSHFNEDLDNQTEKKRMLPNLDEEEHKYGDSKVEVVYEKKNNDKIIESKTCEESFKNDDQRKPEKSDITQSIISSRRDEDEEMEDKNKFIDWLPPEDIEEDHNASSNLNKYGY